jgi:phytoene dehydrogenase-like protein
MNGYRTEICEKNTHAGGLCASWKRAGFTFDLSTHWLVGTGKNNVFHTVWSELGVLRNAVVHNYSRFKTVQTTCGRTFSVHADIDRLEQEMLDIAPRDRRAIHRYCEGIRAARRLELPILKARETYSPMDWILFPFRHFRLIRFVISWRHMTIKEFSRQFTNDVLREIFINIFTDHEDFSMVAQLFTLAWYANGQAGRPDGGSATVLRNLENRYRELGGVIHFRKPVRKILTEEHRAIGVECADNTRFIAEYVVGAADLNHTITTLLDTGNRSVFRRYFHRYKPFPSFIDVSLGLSCTLPPHTPHTLNYFTDIPITLANGATSRKLVSHYFAFDSNSAPKGKCILKTHIRCREFDYWSELYRKDRSLYEAEKKRIADQIVAVIDEKFSTPGCRIRDNIEVMDISTPMTYYRWTNNFRGSYEGWIPEPRSIGRTLRKTVPGVKNLYLTGHWLEPGGGLPAAAVSGRNIAQIICQRDGRRFRTLLAGDR